MPAPPPATTPLAVARGAFRAALGAPGVVLIASFIGFGGLAHGAGWPLSALLLSTVLIWALPGQTVLLGAIAAGASPAAAVFATSLSAVRLLPMVVSLMPLLRSSRSMSVPLQLLCAHYIAQTAWVEGFRSLPGIDRSLRPAWFLGFANGLMILSAISSTIGYLVAGRLPLPLMIGMVFLTPVFFLLSLERGARRLEEKLAVGFGLLLCPVMVALAPGLDLLWTGLVGGGLAVAGAAVVRRVRR